MSRRRKKNKSDYILIVLIIIFGSLLLLNKCLSEKNLNKNKKDNGKNITVEKSTKKEETKKENKKITSKTEEIKKENKETESKKEEVKKETGPKSTEEEETKKERDNNATINIELIGEDEITINKGEKYVDQGVKATDSDGNDVTDEIEIINGVDTSKSGKYSVVYSYGKNIVIRKVIVK